MKHLILYTFLLILCVSCASSRTELVSQHTEKVSTVMEKSSRDYSSELLSSLLARLSDSVHLVFKTYYPPSDSDSVGALKSSMLYQRKSSAAVDNQKSEKSSAESSAFVHVNDSVSEITDKEIERQSSAFAFNCWYIPIYCILFRFIYLIVKKRLNKT